MSKLEIVQYPHPALRWVSKPVREVNDEIRRIAREMLDLMYAAKGIGLAANQVALPFQLFVLNPRSKSNEADGERVFINPRIMERKGIVQEEEGCLSLPGIFGTLKRAERIKIAAIDLDGKPFELEAEGLASRAIQHEVDHLHGILFTDKLNPLEKIRVIIKIREMEKNFRRSQKAGEILPNEELNKALGQLEAAHC
jgi:peptide deformylase